MARTPKALPVLTAVEKKEAIAGLKTALVLVNTEHGKFVSDHKAAVKSLAAIVKEQDKVRVSMTKLVTTAEAKASKATAAAEVGRAKIAAKLALINPPKVVAETAAA